MTRLRSVLLNLILLAASVLVGAGMFELLLRLAFRRSLDFSVEMWKYAVALKQRSEGRGTLALRRLLGLYREYPRLAFLQAVTLARQYGLFDLDRLERLTLRVIAKEYFILRDDDGEPDA